jgi:hypothetical protein
MTNCLQGFFWLVIGPVGPGMFGGNLPKHQTAKLKSVKQCIPPILRGGVGFITLQLGNVMTFLWILLRQLLNVSVLM